MDFRLCLRRSWGALVGLLLSSACASPGAEIHFSPIFSHHSVPGYDHAEAAGGLLRREQRGEQTVWALSPIWWRRSDSDGNILTDFVYPLGRHQHYPDRPHTRTWFLPLFWYEREPNVDGVMETDWFLLPFIGGSADDGSESSFGVFPFYAKLENVLAMDELTMVMFPLYVRNRQNGRNHTWLLWPFFGWRDGAGSSGWHIWPLYSHAELENKYTATWLLWPFISFRKEKLDREHHLVAYHFWPVYGRITRDDYTANTILWPVFGWASRPSTEYTAWNLWPFLRFENAPDDGRTFNKIWPLWMNYEDPKSKWTSLLWPIIWYRHSEVGGELRENWWLVPFWHRNVVSQNEVVIAEEWQLWPLAHTSSARDDASSFRFPAPALAPLFDPPAMSRNWGPFYEVWAENSGPDRSWSDARALGNLYHAARAEGHDRWSIPVLGGRWREPDGTTHWSLCAGLLRWHTGPDGSGMEAPAFPGPGWPSLNQ